MDDLGLRYIGAWVFRQVPGQPIWVLVSATSEKLVVFSEEQVNALGARPVPDIEGGSWVVKTGGELGEGYLLPRWFRVFMRIGNAWSPPCVNDKEHAVSSLDQIFALPIARTSALERGLNCQVILDGSTYSD